MNFRPYRCLVISGCLLYIFLVLWLWWWLSGVDVAQTCESEGLHELQSLFPYMAAGGSLLVLLYLCGWVYAAARRQLTECLLPALYPPVAVVSWLLSV